MIVSPRKSTTVAHDRRVRSVQSAKLTMDTEDLDRLWTPENLENLGRTYWRFLTKVTLGLIRVVYDQDSRSVVLLARPLTLLRFDKPDYTMEPGRGLIRWKIRDGLLVARAGRSSGGFLSIEIKRLPPSAQLGPGRREVLIEVQVANFYPSIAAGFSTRVYEMTQSVLHVLVTHAYLRSLTTLNLAQSAVGALRTAAWPRSPQE